MSKIKIIFSTDPNIEDEFYLSDTLLSLKAKGLLAMMLAYPKPDSFKIDIITMFLLAFIFSVKQLMCRVSQAGTMSFFAAPA